MTNVDQLSGSAVDASEQAVGGGNTYNEQSTSIAPTSALEANNSIVKTTKRRRSPRQRKKPSAEASAGHVSSQSPRKSAYDNGSSNATATPTPTHRRQSRHQRNPRNTSDPDTDSSCDFASSAGQRQEQQQRRYYKALPNTTVTSVEEYTEDLVYEDNEDEFNGNGAIHGRRDGDYSDDDYDDDDDDEQGEYDESDSGEDEADNEAFYDEGNGAELEADDDCFEETSKEKSKHRFKSGTGSKRKTKARQFTTQRTPSNESYEAAGGRIISKSQMRGK